MSKHTPGPYLTTEDDFIYVLDKKAGVNRWAASVKAHNGFPKEEAKAVRDLFAAAPEMLEALKELNEPQNREYLTLRCASIIKAAIAKAEGK